MNLAIKGPTTKEDIKTIQIEHNNRSPIDITKDVSLKKKTE